MESIKRIVKSALISFRRNASLSTATVLVMVMTLFVIGGLLLSSVLMNTILDELENKIDVSVYFLSGTDEDAILALKKQFEQIPNVRSIEYVSQAQALEIYKQDNKDNKIITDSLSELVDNPLEASLNITAVDPTKFSDIVAKIEARKDPTIDKVDYHQYQQVIDRFANITRQSRTAGAVLAAVLAAIAILMTFNTVRLAIYTSRDEISVMRLVGATAWYIRGPFLVEGIIDGLIAAVITSIIFFPITWFLAPKIVEFTGGANIFHYFRSNFFEFLFILIGVGVILGAVSSVLAIRRYLKV